MANLKNRLMGHLYEMYRQGKGMKRKDDPENRYIHSHSTMQVYCREVERFTRWLRTQGVKSRCSDQEAAAHVQEYLDTLVEDGKSENSVHVAAAALAKVLHHVGVRMRDLEKPRRTAAPHKGRQEAPSLAGRKDAQMDSEEHERLVRFALAVGIRRSEYEACGEEIFACWTDIPMSKSSAEKAASVSSNESTRQMRNLFRNFSMAPTHPHLFFQEAS